MIKRLKIIIFMGFCFLLTSYVVAKNPTNTRDPFQPMNDASTQKDLSEYPINTIQLIGIIKREGSDQHPQISKDKIVIADQNNHVYFLNLGDVICLERAKIKNILEDGILLEWTFQNQIFTDRLKLTKEE